MKLTYFNGRGLAETSRVLLAIGGEKYEDFRYPITVLDCANVNTSFPEFKDLVKSLGLDLVCEEA